MVQSLLQVQAMLLNKNGVENAIKMCLVAIIIQPVQIATVQGQEQERDNQTQNYKSDKSYV